ncbi:MAG: hypothetical protein M3N25_07065 [Actinomycetota bacterium]|nr:hypothetical protein [Actinomycetota bacterium]
MDVRSSRYLALAVAALGVAACSGSGPTDAGSAPLRPTSTSTSEPAGEEAPTTTEASPPATAPEGQDRSGGAAPPGGPAMPFVANTRPDTSTTTEGFPVLLSVTKGDHPGYVRYVFEFDDNPPEGRRADHARPAWDVRYVPRSQVVRHGSGAPVPVEGAAVLNITFEGAAMHWDDGRTSLRHPMDAHPRLRFGGDFEGYVTWFLGLGGERPFRAFFTDGDKVVVDVVTR